MIIGCAVPVVRHAITIAVTPVPAATLQLPAVVVLRPCGLGPAVAMAFALPVPGLPDVAVAASVSIAVRPNVAATRFGHHLVAGFWWSDVEVNANLGVGRQRSGNASKRSNADRCQQGCTQFHGFPSWQILLPWLARVWRIHAIKQVPPKVATGSALVCSTRHAVRPRHLRPHCDTKRNGHAYTRVHWAPWAQAHATKRADILGDPEHFLTTLLPPAAPV